MEKKAFVEKPKPLIYDGFVKSVAPFHDICVIFGLSRELKAYLWKTAEKMSFHAYEIGKGMVLSDIPFGGCMVSGYGKVMAAERAEDYFVGAAERRYRCKESCYGIGNYTVFVIGAFSVFACHDYFGMGNLYVYHNEEQGVVALSNRAHLVARIASFFTRMLNLPYIYSQILSSHHFRQDAWNEDTPIRNVQRVPVENAVFLHDGKIHFLNKKDISLDLPYEALLQKAEQSIRQDLKMWRRKCEGMDMVFDLSGGKDSRACLAPVIQDDGIIVHSKDVPGSRDLELSETIVSMYDNVRYEKHFHGMMWKLSPKESLSIWRSYFMGAYNRLSVANRASLGSNRKVIVSGGCGELYRTYWNVNRPEHLASFSEWIAYILQHKEMLLQFFPKQSGSILEYVRKTVVERFQDEGRPEDAMSNFYNRTRLRTHFGGRLFSTCMDAMTIFPLLNEYLYSAMKMLPHDKKDEAALFYDFIRLCDDKLAHVDFDGDFRYQRMHQRYIVNASPERFAKAVQEYRDAAECYTAEIRKNIESLLEAQMASGGGQESVQEDKDVMLDGEAVLNYAFAESIARLVKAVPQLSEFLLKLDEILCTKNIPSNIRQVVTSRILALDDWLFPSEAQKEKYMPDRGSIDELIYPVKGYAGTKFQPVVRCYENIEPDAYKFCLYLMKDKSIVKKFNYQDSRSFSVSETQDYNGMLIFCKNRYGRIFIKYCYNCFAQSV